MRTARTYVYIDGFNLYYGALKYTTFKWLDIEKLIKAHLRPYNDILKIKYYTARVAARTDDKDIPQRQDAYLRALGTIDCVEIVEGTFLESPIILPTAESIAKGGALEYVEVVKPEEKGSDVNLAVHMVNDAHNNLYDVAIVVSNDSDLAEAVRIVTQERGKTVGIINPQEGRASYTLARYAHFVKSIRSANILQACQFDRDVKDATGAIVASKPPEWDTAKPRPEKRKKK